MLELVRKDGPGDRLTVACAHIEVAVAHINNEAQGRIPISPGDDCTDVDVLRTIVRALDDIRAELKTLSPAYRPAASQDGHAAAAAK